MSMRFASFEQLDGRRFAIPVRSIFQVTAESDGEVRVWFKDDDGVRVCGSFDEIVARINALDVPTVVNHPHHRFTLWLWLSRTLCHPGASPMLAYS
jgi:hypothetical protein